MVNEILRIFLTADWHLSEGAWKNRAELNGDAFKSLERLVELVNDNPEQQQTVVIAAGDLFDIKKPSSEVINRAVNTLDKLDADLAFIQGQHEMSEIPWLDLTTGTHIHKKCISPLGSNIFIYGLDWTLGLHLQPSLDKIGEELQKTKKEYPDSKHILVLHQTCHAAVAGIGDDREQKLDYFNYRDCELKDGMIPYGFDLIVVGDTHNHAEFTLKDKAGIFVPCVSPGSFAMQSVSETNSGKCFVIDIPLNSGDDWVLKSQELYVRPYQEITINTSLEFDKEIRTKIKLDEVIDNFERPIIRYQLYEKDVERCDSLTQACTNKAFPFYNYKATTVKDTVVEIGHTESTTELVAAAIKDSQASEGAKKLLNDLITGNSSDEILSEYYKSMVLKS